MKHLISEEHHPHLKKRAFLELLGLSALIWLSIDQRALIFEALGSIRESDVLFLFLLFSMYWLLLPLTAISYRMLASKKIPISTTALAQLAGAGPGRIIPGGLGHLSMAAVHLSNSGYKLRHAIVIAVANNTIGFIVNAAVVTAAIIIHPTFHHSVRSSLTPESFILLAFASLTVFAFLQWLSHFRKTRKTIRKVNREWRQILMHLLRNPHQLLLVILIAATIIFGHMAMLILAGHAVEVYIVPVDALIALGAGVLLGGVVPTPGGLGAVEAGTTTALILIGYDAAEATSAALLFRTTTYWMPLLPGTLSYLYLRERKLL